MNLSKIISFILLRTDSVDDVLRVFDKTQRKLVALSERLRELAVKEEAEAQAKLEAAKRKTAEAERATTVADRISALTK